MQSMQILITGGTKGIGRDLALRYARAGHRVLVTGRSHMGLEGVEVIASDASSAPAREALIAHVRQALPELALLINNAGIQRRVALAVDTDPWPDHQREIDTLLAAPVHYSLGLVPLLLQQPASAIVNVTSGGAYVPQVFAPLYSACKAAMHSYTVTLRHALAQTSCRVVELVPPAVQTGLGGVAHGAPLEEFGDAVFAQLERGEREVIGFGATATIATASREELESAFAQSAARAAVPRWPAVTP